MDPADTAAQAHTIQQEYEHAIAQALQTRDAGFRRLKEHGARPVDIEKGAGVSRETVRQALNPQIREALRERRANRTQGDTGA